jgi:hypothetical protein
MWGPRFDYRCATLFFAEGRDELVTISLHGAGEHLSFDNGLTGRMPESKFEKAIGRPRELDCSKDAWPVFVYETNSVTTRFTFANGALSTIVIQPTSLNKKQRENEQAESTVPVEAAPSAAPTVQ